MILQNNTILITGAGTGMGLAAAKWFAGQGNKVILVARNEERLKAIATELPNSSYIACDLSERKQLETLVKTVINDYPELNMVFLNAGIAKSYSLLDHSNVYEDSIGEMVTNFHSAVYLTHQLEPLLAGKSQAAFILTTSGVAFVPDLLHPTYSATKAALHNYILGLRLVLDEKNRQLNYTN
jgi:Short-chain dehydrogenase involved in D-alanine esterification of lipoteichoic acid and wall teichoic acid (D-alanine transfer protein)